ncbi:MAG TPA: hypothetical protein VFT58_00055 [Nitrososphaera sp.]|nr:hypothetical protein [uncultured Nitrososphaera sp.]HEU4984001.1 hypothetical protein [Nitrososphaera sp.]
MQGIQKAKCASCGIMFMSENNAKTCPECSSHGMGGGSHDHGSMGGCGCGGHHH